MSWILESSNKFQGETILWLLASKDQMLLMWNTLLVMNRGCDTVNRVTGLSIKRDGLAGRDQVLLIVECLPYPGYWKIPIRFCQPQGDCQRRSCAAAVECFHSWFFALTLSIVARIDHHRAVAGTDQALLIRWERLLALDLDQRQM